MRGVVIAPVPTQGTPLHPLQRSLRRLQQRRRQLCLSPYSAYCGWMAGKREGLLLCGYPGAVSMAAPLRAATSSSSPATAAGSSNEEEEVSNYSMGQDDLLIVGAGVLGRIVAEKWKKDHPGCQTFGQTLTTDHHDELLKLGIKPILSMFNDSKFPYVIFCAPPSQSTDYPAAVRLAASNWNGLGAFLFTSSSAVYACYDNGLCSEDTPVVPIGRSRRTDILLKAENEALDAGGCVLRLAGLYKFDRGAHKYWLDKGIVEARPDHIINIIHYEDAASLAIAILRKQFRNRIFMGCDNHPLSRQEMMDCVNKSGKFKKMFQEFTGVDDPLGKKMDNSRTRAELGWEPKYASFPSFLGLKK